MDITKEQYEELTTNVRRMSIVASAQTDAITYLAKKFDDMIVLLGAMSLTFEQIFGEQEIISDEDLEKKIEKNYTDLISGKVEFDSSHIDKVQKIMSDKQKHMELLNLTVSAHNIARA